MTSITPLRIVELRAENVKRLRAVTIRPDADGNLVVLSGKNGAGKSSALDAIEMALGGRGSVPAEPIRRGADHAEVVVDLGELVVRRTFTPSGGGSLVVSNKEGARFQSPQELLNKLVGTLTFDPLAFSRMKPADQAETLRQLLGLDFTTADVRRADLFVQRTAVNRQVDSTKARVAAMPQHADAPAEPIDVVELGAQLQQAHETNQANDEARRLAKVLEKDVGDWRTVIARTEAEISRLQERLQTERQALQRAVADATAAVEKALKVVDLDTRALTRAMQAAETTNRKVRENHERQRLGAEAAQHEAESRRLTDAIGDIDEDKERAIAAAPMPVPGLGFGGAGVSLNGLPLEQASGAERLRVSVAIGLAMNPRLRVLLVRDASLLDDTSMQLLAEMAAAAGAQVWLERIPIDGATSVVIEDGEVQAVGQEAAP